MSKVHFISILCLLMWLCSYASARCVMRDVCIEIFGLGKPCPFHEEPPPLLKGLTPEVRAEILELVEWRCPHLLYDKDGNRIDDDDILACCDPFQLYSMSESMGMSDGILGRCPTCAKNYVRQICEMNCSPDQSRFMDVYTEVDADTGIEYVNEVDYRLYNDFMINAHTSCAGVMVPQTGMPAINLMCGNAVVCDADAWFGFTGDTTINPMAPVHVNFLRWPTEEDSMNAHAPLCNETEVGDISCSCLDCFANCPTGNEPLVEDICTVLSVNCIGFSVGLVFFVITVFFFTVLTLLEYKRLRNADLENNDEKYQHEGNKLDTLFQMFFGNLGAFCAGNTTLVIMITTWIAFGMVYGVTILDLTSKPLELWSDPDSRSREELNYFNSRFGPFYRASQVFLTMKGLESFVLNNITYGPAYRIEAIEELVRLENAIIDIGRTDGTVTLDDVCHAPLRRRGEEKRFDQCITMSVSTYLPDRNNINNETYLNDIQNCLNNYLSLSCLASWGGGADPEISVGGFKNGDMLTADTLLMNFPITNYLSEDDLQPVMEWEQKFLDLMHDYDENWKADFVEVAFGAERSVEDEIRRVSEAEVVPIAISYILMFIYVIFSLGNIRSLKTCIIDSKATVGFCCILVVLTSIFCAMGFLGYINVTLSLLAINVIPFFILSVGIDNVFLMTNRLQEVENNLKNYDDYNENFDFSKKRRFVFAKMMASAGPSIFVTSITQITSFGIATLANFPAVRSFAVFATFSLAFLFVFQMTTVVAVLAIDYKRANQNRLDIFCCIQKKILNNEDNKIYHSITRRLMKPYAKFLLNWRVKIVVVIIFMFLVSLSAILIPQIEVGLDQEMSLPPDSYVYRYLQAVNQIMYLGPPVYFVLKSGLNFTDNDHQNVICGGQLCNEDSLTTQIFLASRYSNVTYIARSSNSWLDDFIDWSSLPGSCCKYNTTNNGLCGSTDDSPECAYCSIDRAEYANGLRPSAEAFYTYIPFFLQDEPTDVCNKGGLASYYSFVNYELDSEGRAIVHDSNFMAYHSSLVTSKDYITAVHYGYEISANITSAIKKHTGVDVEVFPFSVFYVYYEQYLNMWRDTFASIGYCLLGALFINLIMTGFNLVITCALMVTVVMIVVDMMGVMYIWNIPLNAVSNMNLIVSIGIGVEFCSHLAYAYTISMQPPNKKVAHALKEVGGTIITGITFTNIPIIVLAFSYTELIEVFFFRMFFSLVILGFLHGMIFFPVFLSYLNDIKYKSRKGK